MYMKRLGALVAAAAFAFFTPATTAKAVTVDVDLMFVIDRSGSMQTEFDTLGARIGDVLSGLSGATNPNNGVSIGSVHAGLVTYLNNPRLEQSVTGNVATLENAFNAVTASGSVERGLTATEAVLPGGSLFNQAGWRNNTVKSIVLITDETGNDGGYSNSFGAGPAGLGQLLDDVKYFNNIITLQNLYSYYDDAARPSTGLFDLNTFRLDASAFLIDFANTKIAEITTGGTTTGGSNVVPLPAAGWMLLAGLGGLAAIRRRKDKAAA